MLFARSKNSSALFTYTAGHYFSLDPPEKTI